MNRECRNDLICFTYEDVTDDTIYRGYLVTTDADKDSVVLQEGETIDYRWVTREEFIKMLNAGSCLSNSRGQLDEFICK